MNSKFLRVSWKEIGNQCRKLSMLIKKNYKPEIIIGIIRGGLIPSRLLSDYLNVKFITTIRTEFYNKMERDENGPEITQSLPKEVKIENKRVLLVDDVSDSGYSLKCAVDYLNNLNPKEIKTATLHLKPDSKFKPNYYIEETNKWIIYPWEKEENKNV